MKAVVTVVGKDMIGILSKVSTQCAKFGANIIDVTQSVLDGMFCMIMVRDISSLNSDFDSFADETAKLGDEMGMKIHIMHEDIFNSMHRI